MPKVSVDECPAGPALDAAVARVRGHEIVFDKNGLPYHAHAVLAGIITRYVSQYSTDIAAVWGLVIDPPESSDGAAVYLLSVSENIGKFWEARFGCRPGAIGDTAPLAIARAYLKAKGVKYVEVPE